MKKNTKKTVVAYVPDVSGILAKLREYASLFAAVVAEYKDAIKAARAAGLTVTEAKRAVNSAVVRECARAKLYTDGYVKHICVKLAKAAKLPVQKQNRQAAIARAKAKAAKAAKAAGAAEGTKEERAEAITADNLVAHLRGLAKEHGFTALLAAFKAVAKEYTK